MGNRKFYDQLLLDTCQHQQMKVTDPVDITTVKDYMKVKGRDEPFIIVAWEVLGCKTL